MKRAENDEGKGPGNRKKTPGRDGDRYALDPETSAISKFEGLAVWFGYCVFLLLLGLVLLCPQMNRLENEGRPYDGFSDIFVWVPLDFAVPPR